MPSWSPAVLGLAAAGGTGKTILLARLIPLLQRQGVRLAVLKHSHHDCEIDRPGKDSHVLHQAGAVQTLIASSRRTVLLSRHAAEPPLEESLRRLAGTVDLVLVEGYKGAAIPKLELHRPRLGHPLQCFTDPHIIAVLSDEALPDPLPVPWLDLNDPPAVAAFVTAWLRSAPSE
jgi:molybdopterin-guanine dinucleotide biosynthesis protein MobB